MTTATVTTGIDALSRTDLTDLGAWEAAQVRAKAMGLHYQLCRPGRRVEVPAETRGRLGALAAKLAESKLTHAAEAVGRLVEAIA